MKNLLWCVLSLLALSSESFALTEGRREQRMSEAERRQYEAQQPLHIEKSLEKLRREGKLGSLPEAMRENGAYSRLDAKKVEKLNTLEERFRRATGAEKEKALEEYVREARPVLPGFDILKVDAEGGSVKVGMGNSRLSNLFRNTPLETEATGNKVDPTVRSMLTLDAQMQNNLRKLSDPKQAQALYDLSWGAIDSWRSENRGPRGNQDLMYAQEVAKTAERLAALSKTGTAEGVMAAEGVTNREAFKSNPTEAKAAESMLKEIYSALHTTGLKSEEMTSAIAAALQHITDAANGAEATGGKPDLSSIRGFRALTQRFTEGTLKELQALKDLKGQFNGKAELEFTDSAGKSKTVTLETKFAEGEQEFLQAALQAKKSELESDKLTTVEKILAVKAEMERMKAENPSKYEKMNIDKILDVVRDKAAMEVLKRLVELTKGPNARLNIKQVEEAVCKFGCFSGIVTPKAARATFGAGCNPNARPGAAAGAPAGTAVSAPAHDQF